MLAYHAMGSFFANNSDPIVSYSATSSLYSTVDCGLMERFDPKHSNLHT